jgi:hypothetical protein
LLALGLVVVYTVLKNSRPPDLPGPRARRGLFLLTGSRGLDVVLRELLLRLEGWGKVVSQGLRRVCGGCRSWERVSESEGGKEEEVPFGVGIWIVYGHGYAFVFWSCHFVVWC